MRANDNAERVPHRPQRGKKGGRTRFIALRVDEAEYVLIDDYARTAGLSVGAFLRACALGSPGPRARRRAPVDAQAMAHAAAALNKVGSNLNQIARVLNAGGAIGMGQEHLNVLGGVREALDAILEAAGRKSRL